MNSVVRENKLKAVILEGLAPAGAVKAVAWLENQSRSSNRWELQYVLRIVE